MMDVLERINLAYQNLFKRDRLKLITEMDERKVQILEQSTIKDIYWKDENVDERELMVVLSYQGNDLYYESGYFEDNFSFFLDKQYVHFEKEELKLLASWWRELDFENKVEDVRMERREKAYHHAKETHVNLRIEQVEKGPGCLIYTLSNGEKIHREI